MSEQAYQHIWQVPVDHPAFAGHFPGRPIVPGVLILDQAVLCAQRMQQASEWQIVHSKFLRPVGPGAQLQFTLTPGERGDIAFAVEADGHTVASGKLQAVAAP